MKGVTDGISPLYISCRAVDDTKVKNISLYLTDRSNRKFILNRTVSIDDVLAGKHDPTTSVSIGSDGRMAFVKWNIYISPGNYTWNCQAYDNKENSAWGVNRSFYLITLENEEKPQLPEDTEFFQVPPSGKIFNLR